MKTLKLLALLLLISVFGFSQTHTFCPLDGNCVWTKAQVFSDTNGTKHVTSNTTDLGTQVNTLITALGSQGGVIHIAKNIGGYTIANGNEINADNSVNLTIVCDGGVTAGAQAATKILYTGTGTPISARSTTGFRFLGCQVVATNASITGEIIDLGHAGANGDSALFEIANDSFFGSGVSVPIQISTDKANSGSIHNNNFSGYAVAIQGMALGSTYSNQVSVRDNHFSTSTGTAVTAHIQNPGQAWNIVSNTFEQGAAAGTPKVLDCNAANTGQGVKFDGNWIGDDNAVGAHTYINCSQPLEASGNNISGTASTTFFSIAASGFVQATANDFTTALFVFDVTAGNARLDVDATNIFNSAPVLTGTPLLGTVYNSALKNYGQSQATSGTLAAPSYSFQGSTNSGFFFNANSRTQYSHGGTAGLSFDNTGVQFGSTHIVKFCNAADPNAAGSCLTGLSRGADGQVNVGNGTAADASGTIKAAGFIGSGSPRIATGSASNTDPAGKLTLVAGTATYTFTNTYLTAPICISKDLTTSTNATNETVTTTTLTLTGTGTDQVKYICIGLN
jgi:hypothetical protein